MSPPKEYFIGISGELLLTHRPTDCDILHLFLYLNRGGVLLSELENFLVSLLDLLVHGLVFDLELLEIDQVKPAKRKIGQNKLRVSGTSAAAREHALQTNDAPMCTAAVRGRRAGGGGVLIYCLPWKLYYWPRVPSETEQRSYSY